MSLSNGQDESTKKSNIQKVFGAYILPILKSDSSNAIAWVLGLLWALETVWCLEAFSYGVEVSYILRLTNAMADALAKEGAAHLSSFVVYHL